MVGLDTSKGRAIDGLHARGMCFYLGFLRKKDNNTLMGSISYGGIILPPDKVA